MRIAASLLALSGLLGLFVVGCDGSAPAEVDAGPPDGGPPEPMADAGPPVALDYREDRYWLCRPGMEGDECLAADLSATEVLLDGSFAPAEGPAPAEDPAYDCFYVYPTVALSGGIGNVGEEVLEDHRPMLDPLLSQGAWFRGQCRVFAPLYRQITITTYFDANADAYLENAYVDVAAAFARFLEEAPDRPFVILGHSQGAHMTRRLLQRVIDPDPELRARMIAGLLIGGDVLDDHFESIAPCTSEEEIGCVVAYRTYAEGFPPTREMEAGLTCANPSALGGGEGRTRGAYFPLQSHQEAFSVAADVDPSITTPFLLFRDLYASECVPSGEGQYLEVRVRPGAGDVRANPVPFDAPTFSPSVLGLHIADYNFFLGDLLQVVETKATAMGL
jgi:pimeloyl-ACP methyl ester carboxylesterase